MQTDRAASEQRFFWLPAATGRAELSTPWLFVLLVYVHLGYYGFPHPWAAAVAGIGLFSAVLVWGMRGPRWSVRWLVCLWGTLEGAQIFACQMAWNWVPVRSEVGICEAYVGLPLAKWGLVAVACLTALIAKDRR